LQKLQIIRLVEKRFVLFLAFIEFFLELKKGFLLKKNLELFD
jgi:hypothetical protein